MKLFLFYFAFCVFTSANASDLSWKDFLKQSVEINTHTKNLEGLKEAKAFLTKEFLSLGFQVNETQVSPDGRSVLVIELKDATPTIAFYAHIDTVFPNDSAFKSYQEADGKVFGPGVIDMKGGIALIRELVRDLSKTSPETLKKIRILMNDDEETGSQASKATLQKYSAGIQYGLVFEPGAEKGEVVSSQSGIHWREVTITGKAAHAGLEHQKGRNACVELAKMLPEISKKTNYKNHFTVSVGILEGGTAVNTVCEKATVKIDVRYVRQKDLVLFSELVNEKIRKLPEGFSGETKSLVDIPSLSEEKTKVLTAAFQQAAKSLKQPIGKTHVGYVADSNHLQSVPGLQLLVGIGPFGSGMHSDREFMQVSSFESRRQLVLAWLKQIL